MSVYRHQGKWRYEFMRKGVRYRDSGFETKQMARDEEAEARKNLKRMNLDFLRLCKGRLRDVKARRTRKYLKENVAVIKKLIKLWGREKTILRDQVEDYLMEVATKSAFVANKELRFIKALFNFGIEREWFT